MSQDTRTRGLSSPDSFLAGISNSRVFKDSLLVCILLNAVWIGIEVDWRNSDNAAVFRAMELVFTGIFTSEIVIRVLSYRKVKYFVTDEIYGLWNLFDGSLVLLMLLEVFSVSSNLKTLSTLRMFRLIRITRFFRMVPELAMIINAIGASVRSVTSSFAMFVCVAYVFAIVLTQFAKDNNRMDKEHFGSVISSMLTLLQIAVYDDAFQIIRLVMDESVLMGAVLMLFLTGGAFMILNILIGVIRQIVSDTTQKGKEEILMDKVQKTIQHSLITRGLYEHEIKDQLRKMKVDEKILQTVYSQLDSSVQGIHKDALVAQMKKLLHAPETQDMLLAMRNLETFRHKLITRCALLTEQVPRVVEEKILTVIRMKAPDVYRRLKARRAQETDK